MPPCVAFEVVCPVVRDSFASMDMRFRLYCAPDNASLVVRLAMNEMRLEYETVPVDRATREQDSASYRSMAPTGLIPCLETPDGPIFETGAILLWLGDRHGLMVPAPDSAQRASFLKWLFFVSNTLHADLRILFHPERYAGADVAAQAGLRANVTARLRRHLDLLEGVTREKPEWLTPDSPPSVLTYYIACLMRWMALYPHGFDRNWFSLSDTAALRELLHLLELRPAVERAAMVEGLGVAPFTKPQVAFPPLDGSVS